MGKVKDFFKKKKGAILQLTGSLVMLLIAAFIGIMLGLNKTNNIDKYVNDAMEYFSDSDWAGLYQFSESIDNDFINELFFEEVALKQYGEIKEDTASVDNIVEGADEAYAQISYKTTDGEKHSCKLYLTKKDEINYLFFNEWKLDIGKMIIRGSKVSAPTGFAVYMDGVQLTIDNAVIEYDETTGMDTYTIPRLFSGEHTIYFQKDGVEIVEAAVIWNENQSAYELEAEDLQLAASQEDCINGSAQDIVLNMYTAIFNEGGISEASEYFVQDEATISMLTAVYDNMLAAINPDDGSTLNSMEITTFDKGVIEYTYPNQVSITLNFECTFAARGPRSSKGGVRDKYEGTTSSEIKMHFVLEEGEWLCDNLDMTCIDYSKKEETE